MLVSPSDFSVKLERASNSSQSFGKNYSSFLDFTRNYERMSGIFVPCNWMKSSVEECSTCDQAVAGSESEYGQEMPQYCYTAEQPKLYREIVLCP